MIRQEGKIREWEITETKRCLRDPIHEKACYSKEQEMLLDLVSSLRTNVSLKWTGETGFSWVGE